MWLLPVVRRSSPVPRLPSCGRGRLFSELLPRSVALAALASITARRRSMVGSPRVVARRSPTLQIAIARPPSVIVQGNRVRPRARVVAQAPVLALSLVAVMVPTRAFGGPPTTGNMPAVPFVPSVIVIASSRGRMVGLGRVSVVSPPVQAAPVGVAVPSFGVVASPVAEVPGKIVVFLPRSVARVVALLRRVVVPAVLLRPPMSVRLVPRAVDVALPAFRRRIAVPPLFAAAVVRLLSIHRPRKGHEARAAFATAVRLPTPSSTHNMEPDTELGSKKRPIEEVEIDSEGKLPDPDNTKRRMDSSGDVEQGGEEEALEHDETEPDGPNQADTEPANNADASAGGAGGVSYQIQMRNLPTKASEQDVRAACAGFELSRVKKAKKWNYAFVTFKSKEDRDRAMEKLADVSVKGQQVQLESIDDTWRPNANGTGNAQRGRRGMKKSRNEAAPDDSRTPQERLADQVTPLWRMPYAQQLAEKTKVARDVLVGVRKSLKELAPAGASTMQWLDDGVLVASGLPCPLLDIVPSPIETHYRTKCEFSFGVDPWGKQTLGFLLGLVKDGYTAVLDASECLHVSEAALRIRSVMQEYADGHEWKAYDRIDKTGTWRLLVVKTFWSGENQAIVQINPSGMSRERLDEEKRLLAEFFERKISAGEVELKSLMWQEWDGVFNGFTDKEPLVDLIGDGYVHEDLCGLRFRVSPNAFFQVNTPATEKLYGIVREWCGLSPDRDTTLLDLCCGTGTIGLTMAKVARRIVGVELSADAVRDAAINAEVNGLREGEDVEYICARVEDALAGVFGKLKGGEKVVAVLDPPREGVHPSVTKAIRNCADLKQLVYVACNPAAASRNFIDLCRPTADKFPGRPFRMTKAVPVDLFPQTKLVEVVVFFERD